MYSLAAPLTLIVFLHGKDIERFPKRSIKIITASYLLRSTGTSWKSTNICCYSLSRIRRGFNSLRVLLQGIVDLQQLLQC